MAENPWQVESSLAGTRYVLAVDDTLHPLHPKMSKRLASWGFILGGLGMMAMGIWLSEVPIAKFGGCFPLNALNAMVLMSIVLVLCLCVLPALFFGVMLILRAFPSHTEIHVGETAVSRTLYRGRFRWSRRIPTQRW